MYRFLLRPRWIAFHVVVAGAIVAMVNLGFWQLRRLEEKRTFNETVSARIEESPAPLDELIRTGAAVGEDALDDVEWRNAEAGGSYLVDDEVRVVNRSQGGRAGYNVVTPLRLDDGRLLLVARGFVALDSEPSPAPDGDVDVVVRLRQSAVRRTGELSDPSEGVLTELQRIDLPRLAAQLPGELVPMYGELQASVPAERAPYPEVIASPSLDEGPHLSYAVQWFLFSAAVAVGWFLAVRRSRSIRS